ncbi:hypothetical protein [Enterococcus diestrammenae]|uniref:hypothetical protein n=1 Tax=Enterococcus diestrammenae TaxID=1155073 RepID=UPI00195A8D18
MKEETKRKKYYLKKYRRCITKIDRLEEKLSELDFKLEGLNSKEITDMPRGGQPLTLDELLVRKEELKTRINNLVQSSHRIRQEACFAFDALDDERCAEVLEMYFIDLLSFDEIAESKHYSFRHVTRLYSQGLEEVRIANFRS